MSCLYCCQDPSGVHKLTKEQLLESYCEYWCSRMKQVGKEDLISEQRCIEDWLVLHWGWVEND